MIYNGQNAYILHHILWIGVILTPIHSKNKTLSQRQLKRIYKQRPQKEPEKQTLEQLWNHHYNHPINLYHTDTTTLASLKLLSDLQLQQLNQHIQEYGNIKSLDELQTIPLFDKKTIKLIKPFVSITLPWHLQLNRKKIKHTLKLFLHHTNTPPKPPKEPLSHTTHKTILQYTFTQPKLYKASLTALKAPYEPVLWTGSPIPLYGPFSYYSGYAIIHTTHPYPEIIIGDYDIGLGQGLVIGLPFSMDKSTEVIHIMKASYQGHKPSSSTQRKSPLRGISCLHQHNNNKYLYWYAQKSLDLTLHYDPDNDNQPYITTLTPPGIPYHSTKALEKKNSVHEKILGIAITHHNPKKPFTIGAQALYNYLSIPLNLNQGLNHNLFFHGKHNLNTSIFGNILWKQYLLFGEIAASHNLAIATLAGLITTLSQKITTAGLIYRYPAHYHSLHSNAFGQKTGHARNKQGLYLALSYQPIHPLTLKTYLDLSHPIAPDKTHHQPHLYTHEIMGAITYNHTREKTLTLTLKRKTQPKNAKKSTLTHPLSIQHTKNKASLKIHYPLHKQYNSITELQLTSLQTNDPPTNYSLAIKQTIHHKNDPLDIKGWLMLYHAPSFHNAIRIYTHSLRGGLSYPPQHGKYGIQAGILLRYKIKKQWHLGLRLILNRSSKTTEKHTFPTFQISLQIQYKI